MFTLVSFYDMSYIVTSNVLHQTVSSAIKIAGLEIVILDLIQSLEINNKLMNILI